MVAPDEFFSLEIFFCKKNRCVLSSGRLHNISISLGLGCGKISRLVVNTDCISTCIIFYFISALQSNSSILTINTSYIGYDVFFYFISAIQSNKGNFVVGIACVGAGLHFHAFGICFLVLRDWDYFCHFFSDFQRHWLDMSRFLTRKCFLGGSVVFGNGSHCLFLCFGKVWYGLGRCGAGQRFFEINFLFGFSLSEENSDITVTN